MYIYLNEMYISNINAQYRHQPINNIYFYGGTSSLKKVIDIKARGQYPSCTLSNLADSNFTLDGVQIKSMEGFLQSLKVSNPQKQREICALSGFDAKKLSKSLQQSKDDVLYFWNGKAFNKNSKEFKVLISDVINTYKASKKQPFQYKGYNVFSVNTFISSLKSKDIDTQKIICSTPEKEIQSKVKDEVLNYSPRTLYWQGQSFKRDSKEYSDLLGRAYEARYNSDDKFRKAIFDTKDAELTHKKGHTDPNSTILTTQEFLEHIIALRKHLGK